MTLPIAHRGQWLVNLLYVAPLVIAVGVLSNQSLKERRRARAGCASSTVRCC